MLCLKITFNERPFLKRIQNCLCHIGRADLKKQYSNWTRLLTFYVSQVSLGKAIHSTILASAMGK